MISKSIPFAAARISATGDSVELPAGCRFDGINKVFIWRERLTDQVILSSVPPQMSLRESLEHDNDEDYLDPDDPLDKFILDRRTIDVDTSSPAPKSLTQRKKRGLQRSKKTSE